MSGEGRRNIDFSGLVAGLAASAVAVMAQAESLIAGDSEAETGGSEGGEKRALGARERREGISESLAGARQLIDTLAVLEEKTKGNLTEDEKGLLSSALSELRIRYVGLSNRAERDSRAGEEPE
jgi:hypothetical protein